MIEQEFRHDLLQRARQLAQEHFDLSRESESDAARTYRSRVDQLAASGLLRHCVPGAFGGAEQEVRCTALCAIREGLSYADPLADLAFAMQGLGGYPLSIGGTDRLKSEVLPLVASGKAIAALAMTEPEAGSDLLSVQTTAQRFGDQYELNGVKTLVSNAGIADFYVVLARTDPARGSKSLSAFFVQPGVSGFRFRRSIEMIAPHPMGEIGLDRCRVPGDHLIGAEGKGFEIAMRTLGIFRPSVGAAAVGMAHRAFSEAVCHARNRRQFGRPIADFQGIQFKLADMATELDAARLLVYRAADHLDGLDLLSTRESSMAKLFATEAAQRIIDQAVQIHGGRGLIKGAVVERLYREIRGLRIYEGTSEIQRNVIANEILRTP